MCLSRSAQWLRLARNEGRVPLGTVVASHSEQGSRPARDKTSIQQRLGFPKGKPLWQREREGMGRREREGKLLWTVVPPVPYKNAFINGNLLPSQKKRWVPKGFSP